VKFSGRRWNGVNADVSGGAPDGGRSARV